MAEIRRNHDTAAFWEGCRAHELRIARCRACAAYVHPPARLCPACWSDDVAPEAVEGAGHVVSWSLPRVPPGEGPVVTAVVALHAAEGVRLLGRLVGVPPADVAAGMPVTLGWRDEGDQPVWEFVPAGAARRGAA